MSLQARYKKNDPKLPPPTVDGGKVPGVHKEYHYTVKELAELWNFSPSFIYELFANEPGVLTPCQPELVKAPEHPVSHHKKKDGTITPVTMKRGKRKYCPIRIPESVVMRVHARYDGKVA